MKNLPKWKYKLICWLAGTEPVLLNFCIMPGRVPVGMSVMSIPSDGDVKSADYYGDKCFLVPLRNVSSGGILKPFNLLDIKE